MDFHLGDRIFWLPHKKAGIIIDLLEYDCERKGKVGILLDETKVRHTVEASKCVLYDPPQRLDPEIDELIDHYGGFPPSDVY